MELTEKKIMGTTIQEILLPAPAPGKAIGIRKKTHIGGLKRAKGHKRE